MDRSFSVRNLVAATLAVAGLVPAARAADPVAASTRASAASLLAPSVAGGVLVSGTLGALQLSGEAVVASVATVADGTIVVLRGASDAGAATIRLAGDASVATGLAVGTAVRVVATGTGCALIVAGRMIALIPDAAGRALVHQSGRTALGTGER